VIQKAARQCSLGIYGDGCRELRIDDRLDGIDVTASNVEAGRIMLYFHGGAHIVGSMWYYTEFLGRLSEAIRMRIIAVDYRLAPEHRFPAGLDDVYCAYRWLRRDQPGASIVVAGDSAGGNLAFALMVKLAMQGERQPDACVGLAPWLLLCPNLVAQRKERKLCAATSGSNDLAPWTSRGPFVRTVQAVQDSILWGKGAKKCAKEYYGEHDATNPLVSPLLASDQIVKQFPPIHLQVDRDEPLYHDAKELAARCRELDVTVEVHEFEDTHHVFQLNSVVFREKSRESLEHIHAFLERCCQPWVLASLGGG